MKKIVLAASVALMGLASMSFIIPKTSTADATFEGVVTYSVSTDNEQMAQYFTGSSLKVYVKGTKSKSVMDMTFSKRTTFTDYGTDDKPVTIIEMGDGSKCQLKEDDTAKHTDPVIKYVDGTKTIAGYVCNKAQATITTKAGQTTVDVYYTDKLPAMEGKHGRFAGLKGFALQFTIPAQQGMNLTMTATDVKSQSVADADLVAPKGLKQMTMAQIMDQARKNAGGN
jgi:GLPGLI family protein